MRLIAAVQVQSQSLNVKMQKDIGMNAAHHVQEPAQMSASKSALRNANAGA